MTNASVYQIKITLKDSKPPIWRRIQVAGNTSLHELHNIIQSVMGWEGHHLYQFIVNGTYYGRPDSEFDIIDDKKVRLDQLLSAVKDKFYYEYDFGDSWYHTILLEKVLLPEPGAYYPVCIKGKRACPPEDCGGIWGYSDLLQAIKDPAHEEHDEMLEWLGETFDPEVFDLDQINPELKGGR